MLPWLPGFSLNYTRGGVEVGFRVIRCYWFMTHLSDRSVMPEVRQRSGVSVQLGPETMR